MNAYDDLARQAFEIAASEQFKHDVMISNDKREAKRAASRWLYSIMDESTKILDVGGESFYADDFVNLVQANLPDADMHSLPYEDNSFDGCVAMHVLEHSPFPLLALLQMSRVVKTGGYLYVAVPHAIGSYIDMKSHLTVLHPNGWAKLLRISGWKVVRKETGKFNSGQDSIEERFLCLNLR